jgi:hypothetical protein
MISDTILEVSEGEGSRKGGRISSSEELVEDLELEDSIIDEEKTLLQRSG